MSAELEEKLIAQDQQLKEKMSQLEEDNINLRKELSFLNIHKKGQESQWKDQLRRLEE